jgi:hypothetical protein
VTPRDEHERGLALFVSPSYRHRFLVSLKSEKTRERLQGSLAHFSHLDPRFATRLTAGHRSIEAVLQELRTHGAPKECYVFSENREITGRFMELTAAVEAVFSQTWGSFISCIPGRLAYFEDEYGERHILHRTD